MDKMDTAKQKWLDALKEGDEVIVESRHNGVSVRKVTKRTPSGQIVVSADHGDLRFDKRGHYRSVDPWNTVSIRAVTQEDLDKIEKNKMLRIVAGIQWNRLTTEKLKTVVRIANEVP